jgi:VanZ family protein
LFKFLEANKLTLIYIPLLIYWLALLAATSFPVEYVPTVGIGDKFEHLFAYLGLTLLLNLTLIFQNKYTLLKKRNSLFTFLIAGIYGGLDEIHQYFIPGRSCELFDFIADLLGILLGIYLIKLLMSKYDYLPQETN